jgi:hypothetical protein
LKKTYVSVHACCWTLRAQPYTASSS